MNKPTPPFHDLEFFDLPAFWTQGDALSRYALLMPVSTPSEFLAFGVLRPSQEVLFVARGQVREHLGEFIARMGREQARVELYARAPVPGWLRRKYASAPPFEGHEYEEPPEPPVNGLTPIDTKPYASHGGALWPEGDPSTRRTLLLPVKDPSRFLALGGRGAAEEVLFALTGSVREELGELIARVGREQSRVELHARPPLPEPLWRRHLSESEER